MENPRYLVFSVKKLPPMKLKAGAHLSARRCLMTSRHCCKNFVNMESCLLLAYQEVSKGSLSSTFLEKRC